MTPLICPALLFVIDNALLVAREIAAAFSVPVVIDNCVNAVVSPTAPLNVVAPPVLVVRLKAPLIEPPKAIVPLPELVSVVAAPNVTASL